MRILAGEARGRVLHSPTGRVTRPTDSRSREALFNILGERVVGARILDLYAGTGAIGLEALSRGAQCCTFVEQNIAAANAIRANIKMCNWQESAQVWQTSVKSALHRMQEQSGQFEIIFADPPFTDARILLELENRVDTLSALLHNVGELSDEDSSALLIVQHHFKAKVDLSSRFELQKSRRAGESLLSFFELSAELSQIALKAASETNQTSSAIASGET